MAQYPAVAAQGLYEASATKRHEIGTDRQFKDANGDPVWARYMQNAATTSVAAGMIVAHHLYNGKFGTNFNSTQNPHGLAGGLAASCALNGYAWVIYKGKQTNASMNSSHASAAGMFFLFPGAAGGLISATSSSSWPVWASGQNNLCAFAESGVSNTIAATGKVVWTWR